MARWPSERYRLRMTGSRKAMWNARIVALLLAAQLLALWLSLDAILEASIFCTVARSVVVSWLFGLLHVLFAALFLLGLLSLRMPGIRSGYIIVVLLAFIALAMQVVLVDQGLLTCDGP